MVEQQLTGQLNLEGGLMFAVGLVRDRQGIHSFDLPRPQISRPDEVLVRVREVGLDGTDFNMVSYDLKDIAEGHNEIALGHEMVGVVEAVGSEVHTLKPGDGVTMTVRRGCDICHPCLHNQSDMCMTGLYTERGIHRLDGFLTEYVVDQEQYIIPLTPGLEKYGVLTEPLSIAEKGIEQIRIIQSRLPWACPHPDHAFSTEGWGSCKTALVLGAGPLGLLATALLRLAGVDTYVSEIVPEDNIKIKMVKRLGAKYIDSRNRTPQEIVDLCCTLGNLDIIFEASGASEMALNLIPYMSRSSIYVMTGIPRGELKAEVDANQILRQIVRFNQVVVGSVNSNRSHFEMALKDMPELNQHFDHILDGVFTHRFRLEDYQRAFSLQDPNRIKIVIEV